jgi:hypothetical protein
LSRCRLRCRRNRHCLTLSSGLRPTIRQTGQRSCRPGTALPHHGGDRLSRVEVVFEVASQRYPLEEQAATLMAENLRVKAAHEPGAEGTVGARAVADAIELRLIEDTADPISLGGDGAEAVYALDVPTGGSDKLWALYRAVKGLHRERLRQES